jgi:hypothetical protein
MPVATLTVTRTTPIFPIGVFVQWSVESDESGDFLFTVSRSGSPQGPWTALTTNAENIFNYMDRWPTTEPDATTESVNQLSLSRGIFYKIDVIPPSGSLNASSAITGVEPQLSGRQRLLKRKMLRDESILLRRFNGTPVAILKRKHWGTRCPDCWDPIARESVRAACTTCYGTGFTGGYYDPIVVYARRTVLQRQTGLAPENTTDVATCQFWILDAPYVETLDIVVALKDGRRFVITHLNNTELQVVTVHQKFDATELPRSAIEHRIFVDPLNVPPLF